jgi:RNA polymerase sigma-70 factor (ECF subfamily)
MENTNYVEYLIGLAKSGRARAYFDLCEINLKNVYNVIYRLLTDKEQTEKITLHTFTRAWEKIKNYNSEVIFSAWIKNLAIGYAIELLHRGEKKSHNKINKDTKITENELIENLILELPLDDRIIFILHDLEGFKYQDIQNFFKEKAEDEIKSILVKSRENIMRKLPE